MLIIFPEGDEIFRLEIRPIDRVLDGHIGYRSQQKIVLRRDIYKQFHYAHCNSDFKEMKKILDNVIDLTSNELPPVQKESLKRLTGI